MRFSITLNNQKCMEWGINATQGILVALLYEANAWANEEIIDDKIYYFVSRNLILKELPMFFEKADTVYRNLKVLAEKGKSWNFIENNSEKNPTNKDTNIQKDINKNNKEKYKKEKSKNEIETYIKDLKLNDDYKQLLFRYVEYRKSIKRPIKTIVPIRKILKDFSDWFSLNEAINIAMEKEWQGLEPEWIAKYKQSKANNNYGKQAEQKDTSQLKVDDDFIEQMKERYGIND